MLARAKLARVFSQFMRQQIIHKCFDLLFQHWLTELEIFAMLFAAAVHDYEHTGTTNNFHIQTKCE